MVARKNDEENQPTLRLGLVADFLLGNRCWQEA
jgi:hypothetical protein